MVNLADKNDIAHVTRLHGKPVAARPCPIGNGGKINPHATTFYYLGKAVTVFHIKPIYYQHRTGAWRPMYEVMNHYGNHVYEIRYEKLNDIHPNFLQWLIKRQKLLNNGEVRVTSPLTPKETRVLTDELGLPGAAVISFTTLTAYPDPHTETTTVDGYAARSGVTETWATITAGAGTTSGDSATIGLTRTTSAATTNNFADIFRTFLLFDTSSIGSDGIDSAILSTYGAYADETTTDFNNEIEINIYGATPASNTAIVNSDYANVSSTAFSTAKPTNDLKDGRPGNAAAAYNDWTLNASGEANINKSGVSKFSVRVAQDASGSAPTWASIDRDGHRMESAEYTGTTRDPKLVVEHSASGTAYTQDVNDAATADDSLLKAITKDFTDAVDAVASIAKGMAISLTDAVNATGAVDTLAVFLVDLAEAVNATASMGSRAITKTFTEAVGAADSLIKAITRELSEAVDVAETVAALTATYTQTLVEAVAASDTLATISGFGRTLTESLQVTDRLQAALNGINAFWSDIYNDTADEWSNLYLDN